MAETSVDDRQPSSRVRLAAAGLVLVLLPIAARFAYVRIFGQFADYDDEGYIMQTVRSYRAGAPLYEEVFSQYGPAFYLYQSLVHGVLRLPLTHDGVRFLTMGLWLAAATLGAAIVFRLTTSAILSALAFVQLFIHVAPLINEPGHPQAILIVAVLLVCLIATRLTPRRAAICGAIVAFAALVKVNVGTYLLFGVAVPLLISSGPGWAGWVALCIVTALPFALLRAHLNVLFPYAAVVSAGMASVGILCQRYLRATLPNRHGLHAFVVSVLVAAPALALPSLLWGTSIRSLVRAILVEPSRLGSLFFMPSVLPPFATSAAIAGTGLALILAFSRLTEMAAVRAAVAALKLAWAFLVLPTVHSGYDVQLAAITPFAWLLLLPGGSPISSQALLARAVLVSTAGLQALQAYPVAGSQVALATATLVVAAFVALDDALRTIASRLGRRGLSGFRIAAAAAAIYFTSPVLSFDVWSYSYRLGHELRIRGAEHLHLPHRYVAGVSRLTTMIRSHCSSLATLPGMYSLNAWSGVPPPTSRNATAWMTLLEPEQQREIWSALERTARPCVVFQRTLTSAWIGGRPLDSLAAYQYLTTHFHTVADVDGYEFMLPHGRSETGAYQLITDPQSFDTNRTALPVHASLLTGPPDSTIRLWMRTRRRGTILACQSTESVSVHADDTLPILYVGRSGQLRAPQGAGLVTDRAVNEGTWHHVALVRGRTEHALYLDGALMGTQNTVPIDGAVLKHCQLGVGFTTDWPDASAGWMAFAGEIDDFMVVKQAWGATQVAQDLIETRGQH